MLKTIIGKLERKGKKKKKTLKLERLQRFIYLFIYFSFKLKRLTQNPKAELKRFWVRPDSGTK